MEPRTQEQRRAETRRRLLEAAREVVADRGVAGASVDAVAGAAGRTSGALYDHFGGKNGLIIALLDEWKQATADAIVADLTATDDPVERLAAVWRNFVSPPAPSGGEWTLLEHELWLHACRQPDVLPHVAGRYEEIRSHLADALQSGLLAGPARRRPDEARNLATLMIGLMVGLEMQRRLDPGSVSDADAVAALRALATAEGDGGGRRRVPAAATGGS